MGEAYGTLRERYGNPLGLNNTVTQGIVSASGSFGMSVAIKRMVN
ncbi:MAG: hypothetical protein N4J56_002221 [Chroococcidiopsis sp. SAG 2025]|nr:hypothetical protein [Chroococcidiopsis sp. SAG 2025]